MAFAKGTNVVILEAKQKVSDADIASYYLGVTKIPCRISSPLRKDKNPSFGLYSRDGIHIYWTDFSTGAKGHIIDLLKLMWGTSYEDTWMRIAKELTCPGKVSIEKSFASTKMETLARTKTQIECHEREWRDYDFEFWNSFGINKEWLEFANVHPISHIIFIKEDGQRTITPADKLAYVYVEFKEGTTTFKVYQPHNTRGFKWFSSHDKSVISLWTKVPKTGDKIVICSSLKDALCLWSNTSIPAISPQGEGYGMSDSAINSLKERYKHIYILFDNDKAGIEDGEKLSSQTGFTNIVLPTFVGGKDVSDFYKVTNNKNRFKESMLKLIK